MRCSVVTHMQRNIFRLALLLGPLAFSSHVQLANAQPATANPPARPSAVPTLTPVNPNQATAMYSAQCSNGANADNENRAAFVAALLANPTSKLGAAKKKLLAKVRTSKDSGAPEAVIDTSKLAQVYYARPDGCGVTLSMYVGFLNYSIPEGDRETTAQFQFVVDDVVDGAKRTLTLRSVTPVKFAPPAL